MVISKDRELIIRSKNQGIPSVYVTKEDEIGQFLEILEHIPLKINTISGDSARCTKCNFTTSCIEKSKIVKKVPEKFWNLKNFGNVINVIKSIEREHISKNCKSIFIK